MTTLEMVLIVSQLIEAIGIYFLTKYNRDLQIDLEKEKGHTIDWKYAFEKEKEENQKNLNKIMDLEKKTKLSADVIAVLNDLKQGGALLHVERIDNRDVFYHNGGQYR